MENRKWKTIAIMETILIAVVLVFIAGFFLGKGKKQNADDKAVSDVVYLQETTGMDAVKETTFAESESTASHSEEETKQSFEVTPDENGLTVSFDLTQEWGSEEEHFYSYTVVLENTGKEPVEEWAAKVPVAEDVAISSSWNTNCSVSDGYLYLKPVDFNKTLEAGAVSDSIGIIMTYQTEPEFQNAVIGSKAKENTDSAKEQETTTASAAGKGGDVMTGYQGKLHVEGTHLADEAGNIVQLRGISTHGIAWFPDYVNYGSFQTLRDEFGANVIRLAMYTGENGGYCTGGDKDSLKKLVENGVDYATDLDMYVIIDWHILSDNNPNTYKTEAIAFFDEMSKKYADNDHVIYEICNEPNGGTSWEEVKSYAEEVIPVIRRNHKDAVILVGTPTWSQDVDKAAANPIKEENIMYVLHFYAATHKDDLRNKMTEAIDGGLPVFISEFSICDASGNGGLDYDSANKWLDVINEYQIGYVGWNLSNKNESSAILKQSCNKTDGYTMDDLSDSGKWLVESFR